MILDCHCFVSAVGVHVKVQKISADAAVSSLSTEELHEFHSHLRGLQKEFTEFFKSEFKLILLKIEDGKLVFKALSDYEAKTLWQNYCNEQLTNKFVRELEKYGFCIYEVRLKIPDKAVTEFKKFSDFVAATTDNEQRYADMFKAVDFSCVRREHISLLKGLVSHNSS